MLYFAEIDSAGYCTNVPNNNEKVIEHLKGVDVK